VLVKRGVAIFDELKHGVEELGFLADPTAGKLRIGSTEGIAAGMLPAIIERFSREYPRAHLDVAQTVVSTLHYRELRERSIDLLIGRIPLHFAEHDLQAEFVYDDQIVVVAARRSKWGRANRIKLADLSDEPWVLPPADTLAGSLAIELFRSAGVDTPRAPITTLSIHLYCQLAASGRFLSVLPISVLRFGGQDRVLKMLPIKLPTQQRPVGIVTLKNRTLSPIAQAFIECVHQTLKSQPTV
jgi:DNA-binding transcriptional LysR family regulator